jgi:hypothetical protein
MWNIVDKNLAFFLKFCFLAFKKEKRIKVYLINQPLNLNMRGDIFFIAF